MEKWGRFFSRMSPEDHALSKKNESVFIRESRTRARAIQQSIAKIGSQISLQQAYDVLAVSAGYRNWATMKAVEGRQAETATNLVSPLSPALTELQCAPAPREFVRQLISINWNVLTAPGEPAPLSPQQSSLIALLASPGGEHTLVVAEHYERHPETSSARMYLRRKGFSWQREFIVATPVIALLYKRQSERTEASIREKQQFQSLFNPIYRTLLINEDGQAICSAFEEVAIITRAAQHIRVDLGLEMDIRGKLKSLLSGSNGSPDPAPFLLLDGVDILAYDLCSFLAVFIEDYPGAILLGAAKAGLVPKSFLRRTSLRLSDPEQYVALAHDPKAAHRSGHASD